MIIQSYVRKFIKENAQMNTSSGVYTPMQKFLELVIKRAIEIASKDGRITVMERDIDIAIQEYKGD